MTTPERSRGVIALIEDKCTSCMLCARECPAWCIHIGSHPVTEVPPAGGRPRTRHELDRFAIDWSLCMYCGICVEVCPFDALAWAREQTPPEAHDNALLHERDRLVSWAPAQPGTR